MECSSCGADVVGGARFCTACGEPSPDATTVFTAPPVPPGGAASPAGPRGGAPGRSTCPVCGAGVEAGRVLCARCGSVVTTGRPGLRPPPEAHRPGRADRVVGSPRLEDERAFAPRVLRLVGVLLAAVALGAAVAWTTSRPAAEEVAEPAPTFDPGAYPTDPVGLPVVGVDARGTADPDADQPAAVLDGERGTAWVAVEPTADASPGLTLALAEPAWLLRVVVVNDGAEGAVPVQRLLLRTPDGATVRLELLDLEGTQEVDLPEPLLVERVELLVEQGVGPGPVALAEVALVGHPLDVAQTTQDGGTTQD